MIQAIFTYALGGASVYFFYENSFFIGLILFTWFLSRLFGYNLKKIFEGIGEITTQTDSDKKANIIIEFKINMAEVLSHKFIADLFNKIRDNTNFNYKSKEEFEQALIENFKKKYNNKEDRTVDSVRYVWESVRFNIKNNLSLRNFKNFQIQHTKDDVGEADIVFLFVLPYLGGKFCRVNSGMLPFTLSFRAFA